MRRSVVCLALLLCFLTGLPARPFGQRPPTLAPDLAAANLRGDRIRVIVQGPEETAVSALRGRLRGLVRRELRTAVALEVSRAELDALARDPAFSHISADATVASDMAITNQVTGASSVWQGSSGLLGLVGSAGFDGSGIGVAVVDSGIAPHTALGNRVIARVNLVSWEAPSTGDLYGHGTHIAGAIAGSTTAATWVTPAFAGGTAPGVRLVDVRVLGANGTGYTSDVIAGIDWAVANRIAYGIRIINLSLGHPVSEPAAIDPLCQAVQRAVAAGVVVVASAGNYGATSSGAPVLGGIVSPGNSPFALTVGAIDTAGTIDRSDDRVTAYSSRGPTGLDLAVKPDVVAPGARLVSLEARGSYLAETYPGWHIAGSGSNAYFRLSGTSMATAVVSGGVALLLDANPGLTPGQVKVALQMGATFVPDEGLIGAGAGSVNFATSLKLAQNGLLPDLLSTVEGLLGPASGAAFRDSGTMIERLYDRTGTRLLGPLDSWLLWQQPEAADSGALHLLGLRNDLAHRTAKRLLYGKVAGWTTAEHVVWADDIQTPSGQHVVWADTDRTDSSHVVWADAVPAGRAR